VKSSEKLNLIQDFEYKIVRSRRQTLSIIVSPFNGVIVRAPLGIPIKYINRFVSEKSEWIIKTLKSFDNLRKIESHRLSDGDKVLFEGKEHNLRIVNTDKNQVRLIDGNTIEVCTKGVADLRLIHFILEAWFKLVARKKLTIMFNGINSKYKAYGFSPTAFTVSRMKKRWGSCSSRGKIAVSYDLIRLDPVFAEYVIIHELCHLRYHNHSAEYYKFLAELYPDWKRVRNELKKYIR
jgi:predicted metal-dependent hydrolase